MAKTYTPSTVHPSAEKELRDALTAKLLHNFSVQPESATNEHFYNALVLVLRDRMRGQRVETIREEVCGHFLLLQQKGGA